MHYLHHVRARLIRLPFLLGAMVIAYLVSVHFGWREPIEDLTGLVPAFLGGIISYIFIVPYLQAILSLN